MKRSVLKLFLSLFLIACFHLNAQQISPYLVGSNLWYTNPSTTVWNLTRDCGVQTIRIGGHQYDTNMPSNATILAWVKQIQAIGAEPVVQVSKYKSAAEAAALVTYLNVTNAANIRPVKFWNIGNEPWLQANKPATSTVAQLVATYFKPISAAMKAVDPTIKIYGPNECYYMEDAYNVLFGSNGVYDIAAKVPDKDYYYCDGITWHRYPDLAGTELAYAGIEDFRGSIVKCKARVDYANTLHGRTGDDMLSWGIGEYNARGGADVHTWQNGQMFGGILGLCMKYEAKFATSWSMFENGGSRTGSDFSSIDGTMKPRASYWHMQFVSKYFKGSYVDGKSNNTAFVVYGAKTETQTSVMIMHRATGAPKEYTLHLNYTGTTGNPYILNVNADQDVTYSDIIAPLTTQVLIFRGDSIIKVNYSSTDFDKLVPPTTSTVTIADALPNAASELIGTATSYNSISLGWTDNSDNELGFIIERETAGVFKTIAMVGANVKTFSEAALTPETTYRYRVVTYNSLGKSDYTEIAEATTLETPAPKAYNGPHSIPGTIQAENFDVNDDGLSYHDIDAANQGGKYRTTSGVDIESCTDAGLGYNIGYVNTGEWLTYLIENVTPGTYDIALRTASNSTVVKRIDVYLDNVKVGQAVPNNTLGWQNWETIINIVGVEILDSEPKLLKLALTGSGFNINWIQFGEGLKASISESNINSKMVAFYDLSTQKIQVRLSEAMDQSTVQIYNTLGQSIYQEKSQSLTNTSIDAANWPKGIYLINVSNQTEHHSTKLVIH
jgi:hypothetical protein